MSKEGAVNLAVEFGKKWLEGQRRVTGIFLDELIRIADETLDIGAIAIIALGFTPILIGLIRAVDAFAEFSQDSSLVSIRIVREMANREFPMPKKLNQRVLTAAESARENIRAMLTIGIAIMDLDLPVELKILNVFAKLRAAADVVKAFSKSKLFAFLKKFFIVKLISATGRTIISTFGFAVILWTGIYYIRLWTADGRKPLVSRTLPQDSRRSVSTHTGRHRTNRKKGPDNESNNRTSVVDNGNGP